jgi:putative ABC transport system permease protein
MRSRWAHAVVARLKAVFRPRRAEQDLDDELAFHMAMQTRANQQQGMSDIEARRHAQLNLGGVEQVKERSRDARPLRWARDAAQDARYAIRALWRTPRFTIAALLTVVLGVGANATIFSTLNPLLFKPLPYREPDRIVNVFRTSPQSERWPFSAGNYFDQRERNTSFEQLTALTWQDTSLAEPGQPAERLFSIRATGNYFALFGVPPLVGRAFSDADDRDGAPPVVVLSYGFWRRRFAGDSRIVGRVLRLDGQTATVIGVMPENFEYPLFWGNVDLWRPFAFPADQRTNRGNNFLREFARLKPGVTFEQADDAIKAVVRKFLADHPDLDAREGARLEPLSIVDPTTRRMSAFAFGLAFLVLLIACANLANLQLARTAARAREFAIRGAIGGAKERLMRQSLTESVVLALVGGALALPLAYWCTQLIARRQFSDLPGVHVTMDPVSLAFAFGCALLTGLIFGVVPAWLASRADVNDVLKQNPQSMTSGHAPQRFRQALIVAEIAFALVALSGATSFIRGLQRITDVDPGWRADGVLAARLNLVGPQYAQPPARRAFFETLRDRAAEIPGITVAAVSSSSVPAFPYGTSTTFAIEGRTDTVLAFNERVTPQYFDVLRIPLRRGRQFTADDRFGYTPVMIVNEAMARALWPNEDPIGKRVGFQGPNPNWRVIVGVVGDVTFPSFGTASSVDTPFEVYQPLAQTGTQAVNVLLKTTRTPDTVAPDLRKVVAALDRDLPVFDMITARSAEQRTTARFRLLGQVLGGFATLGLVLAAIGVFGVVSYSTAQRSGELGMRMALGARDTQVMWLVLKQGVVLTLVGGTAGLAGGLGLSRVLASLMPRLPSPEIALVIGTAGLMIFVALTAMYIPARRASKISPMLALRHE